MKSAVLQLLNAGVTDKLRAVAALGAWVDPAEPRFTEDEKVSFRDLLVATLPSAYDARVGDGYRLAHGTIMALGRAADDDSAMKLGNWLRDYQSSGAEPGGTLTSEAREAIEKIEARVRARVPLAH